MSIEVSRNAGIMTVAPHSPGGFQSEDDIAAACAALAEFQADASLKVALLRGGSESFGNVPLGGLSMEPRLPPVRKHVVAAIAGNCAGEALSLVCASTSIRIVGRGARLSFGDGAAASPLIARTRLGTQIWPGTALYLSLARPQIEGDLALQFGLASQVVDDEDVERRAAEIAEWTAQLRSLALITDHRGSQLSRSLPKDALMFYCFLDYVQSYHYPTSFDETWGFHAKTKDRR